MGRDDTSKAAFDQTVAGNVEGIDFYQSYIQLKKDDPHLSSLVLGRIRRWLGKYDLLTDLEVEILTKKSNRISEGDIASLFQAINKIPKDFIPHFRQAISFSKTKDPNSKIYLPTPLTHSTALMIQALVHPEVSRMMAQTLSLVSKKDERDPERKLRLWERILEETNRLATQFQNPYLKQYPQLWGINPRFFHHSVLSRINLACLSLSLSVCLSVSSLP
jgi:hypothetical protein